MRITNPPAGHDSLDGVSTSDHHTKYSDADAASAVVEDAAYGAGWNADTTHAPSQNAVYDAIEALHAAPSDTAYAISWNGVTAIAPSKNAVYDKIEALHAAPSDTAYANTWNGVTDIAPSKNAVYDKIEALALGTRVFIGTVEADDDATITVSGLDTAVYEHFIVETTGVKPANDSSYPYLRLGDSGGIDSGGTDYAFTIIKANAVGTYQGSGDQDDSGLRLARQIGNATSEVFSGTHHIHTGDLSYNTIVYGQGAGHDTSSNVCLYLMSGFRDELDGMAVTDVQFLWDSGNVTSGRLTVYGVKHS